MANQRPDDHLLCDWGSPKRDWRWPPKAVKADMQQIGAENQAGTAGKTVTASRVNKGDQKLTQR
ncbi:hypothetical protein LIA77_08502 [Sarocladium implicatum]|nr:hypothetical protein LIA77_08502 [Sarocladium implicatum]